MTCKLGVLERVRGATDCYSKELQREQATLSGDKELKANTLRSNGDQISRKTVELGKLRAQADQRKRDEAALRELEGYLGQLQADLKVSRWGFSKLYS